MANALSQKWLICLFSVQRIEQKKKQKKVANKKKKEVGLKKKLR
jgi:hypothetical protein